MGLEVRTTGDSVPKDFRLSNELYRGVPVQNELKIKSL